MPGNNAWGTAVNCAFASWRGSGVKLVSAAHLSTERFGNAHLISARGAVLQFQRPGAASNAVQAKPGASGGQMASRPRAMRLAPATRSWAIGAPVVAVQQGSRQGFSAKC